MRVLGIETSCDETAAAVVTEKKEVLSHVVFSQIESHKIFGGVVPEIGARAHLEKIQDVIEQTMKEANLEFQDLDAIAATCGPGLIGGVLVGAVTGKSIAAYHQKPFIAVNHLEAHALSVRLTEDVGFPYLLLLVSGGHCQMFHVKHLGVYEILGGTLDDAVGETFDKVARLLGLPYPGGPAVEHCALTGDETRFSFPRPLLAQKNYDFSFSGLKTAVLREVEKQGSSLEENKPHIAASFQKAVADIFLNRLDRAMTTLPHLKTVVIAGGVAANQYLQGHLQALVASKDKRLVAPPLKYCTDNGAMVAWAGLEHWRLGHQDPLTFAPRPRWPLGSV
jgi:N6-L-threonylcarbamoyladenine synthase